MAVIWAIAASGASWERLAGLAIALQSGLALLMAAGAQEAKGHRRERWALQAWYTVLPTERKTARMCSGQAELACSVKLS